MQGQAEQRRRRSVKIVLWALGGTLTLHLCLGLLLSTLQFDPPEDAAPRAGMLQIQLLPPRRSEPPVATVDESTRAPRLQRSPPAEIDRHAQPAKRKSSDMVLAPDTSALDTAVAAPHPQHAETDAIWEAAVLAHLERFKHYPTAARLARYEDRIQVNIQVDRQGHVIHHQILHSRGFAVLERAVTDLLLRASPLPQPPPDITQPRLSFRVMIDFTLQRSRELPSAS